MLQEAYLVTPLEKFAARAHRRRSAPPKLVILNNALLSAMHPDAPPDPTKEPQRFGADENACLAFAVNQGKGSRIGEKNRSRWTLCLREAG